MMLLMLDTKQSSLGLKCGCTFPGTLKRIVTQVMAIGTLALCYNNHRVFTGGPCSAALK